MAEKYNLNQLRGAYGAGYYAGKKAEEKVTLTFEDFRLLCGGASKERFNLDDAEYTCSLTYIEVKGGNVQPACKPLACYKWEHLRQEVKIT